MNKIIMYTAILLISITIWANTEGLSSLAKVGKDQAKMERILRDETEAYQAIKKGIDKGSLTRGMPQDEILKKYGAPVVKLKEVNDIERWVYKPGHMTYFNNVKIYLYFDDNKILTDIKVMSG